MARERGGFPRASCAALVRHGRGRWREIGQAMEGKQVSARGAGKIIRIA